MTLKAAERIRRVVFSGNRLRDADRKPARFPAEYKIEVSSDGKTWRAVADARDRRPAGPALRRRRLIEAGLSPEDKTQLVALDDALVRLAALDPLAGELVKLRYFAGLALDQAAIALQVSTATAYRHWAYARAWLYRELSDADARGAIDPASGDSMM